MRLKEFLEKFKIKPSEFAKQLNVSRQAVYDWMEGKRVPKPFLAKKIVNISFGKVSYDEIYSKNNNMFSENKKEGNSLKNYLKKKHISVKNFAKTLGVPTTTVYSWIRYNVSPRNKTAQKIVEITKGEISHQDLHFVKKK